MPKEHMKHFLQNFDKIPFRPCFGTFWLGMVWRGMGMVWRGMGSCKQSCGVGAGVGGFWMESE